MVPADDSLRETRDRVGFGPPPEWVTALDADEAWRPPVETGSSLVLMDVQHHATRHECYRRTVLRMETMTGVQHAAQWRCDFDPGTQRVTIHSLIVRRGGQAVDHATRERLRVFQREENLDRFTLDGTATLVVLLEDVRVGDVLDTSYTVHTKARIFPDRFALLAAIPTERYARLFHLSVRFPTGHALRWHTDSKKIALSEREAGPGETEWSWRVENFAPRPPEPDMPPWHFQGRFIQVSDFASWQTVASGFATAWEESFEHPNLVATAREIAAASASLDGRVERALRLVQDDLRYLSVNTELGGQIPTAPGVVVQRRFGDCKDKVFLLVHLLRLIGVPARPVLVHSQFRGRLDQFLPMPGVFNHVVVEFELAGQRRWVDATIPCQGGGPLRRVLPEYSLGLPIEANVTALEPIIPATDSTGLYEIRESLHLGSSASPLGLAVITTATGSYADALRQQLAFDGAAAVSQAREQFYQRIYPKARRQDELEWRDDRLRNELVLADAYLIPDAVVPMGEPGVCGVQVVAHAIRSAIAFNDSEHRKEPLGLPFPCRIEQRIECQFQTLIGARRESLRVRTDEFSFAVKCSRSHAETIFQYKFETHADHVAPQHFGEHRSKALEVWTVTQLAVSLPSDRHFARSRPVSRSLPPVTIEAGDGPSSEAVAAELGEIAPCLGSPAPEQRVPTSPRPADELESRTSRSRGTRHRVSPSGRSSKEIAQLGTVIAVIFLFLLRVLFALLRTGN